jgi:hypothetical protein
MSGQGNSMVVFSVLPPNRPLGMPIDLSLVEGIVKDAIRQCKNITIDAIKKLVSKHLGTSV